MYICNSGHDLALAAVATSAVGHNSTVRGKDREPCVAPHRPPRATRASLRHARNCDPSLAPAPPPCLRDPKYGTHSFIRVNGVRLHYVERGTGDQLMLFLHGFPEVRRLARKATDAAVAGVLTAHLGRQSWYSWRHLLVEFGTTHRVVAVDMRGYGDSDKPRGVSQYRMETLVEDVHQLIRALGHQRCILVAHDWGAAIAWRFAYTHPEQLNRLVIMNVPHPKGFRNAGLKQLLRSWWVAGGRGACVRGL